MHLATTEPLTLTAIFGLLSGALSLLAAILRYVRKGWRAVDSLVKKVDDTAKRVEALEALTAKISVEGSDATVNIQAKLENVGIRQPES